MLSYSKDRKKTCPEYFLVDLFLGEKQVQTAPDLEPGPFNLPSILLHMYFVALSHMMIDLHETCTSFREKGLWTSVLRSTLTGGSLAMLSVDCKKC